MEKLISRHDLEYYTMLKKVLYNLELNDKDYIMSTSLNGVTVYAEFEREIQEEVEE